MMAKSSLKDSTKTKPKRKYHRRQNTEKVLNTIQPEDSFTMVFFPDTPLEKILEIAKPYIEVQIVARQRRTATSYIHYLYTRIQQYFAISGEDIVRVTINFAEDSIVYCTHSGSPLLNLVKLPNFYGYKKKVLDHCMVFEMHRV